MKRFGLVAAVVAALFAVSSGASASTTTTTMGYRHACTHGQMRCFALIETVNGNFVRPMTAAPPRPVRHAYGPTQYHTAYHLPNKTPQKANGTRKAVTVAIVDAFDDATIYHDLTVYSKTKGIPVMPQCTKKIVKACFKKRNQGAAVGSAVAPGWDVEIALDVETVHAICQNCRIELVEAPNAKTTSLGAAENVAAKHANIISNSFGGYGGRRKVCQERPERAVHPSQQGDRRRRRRLRLRRLLPGQPERGRLGRRHPAAAGAEQHATGRRPRGGRIRSIRHSGTGSGCADGSASGLTPVNAQPFQLNVANYAATGCGSFRGDNDVSANADPFSGSAVYASARGWIKVGGTSLATPLIAGTYALAANAATAKFPASMLYAAGGHERLQRRHQRQRRCRQLAGCACNPRRPPARRRRATTCPPASAPRTVSPASSVREFRS